MTEHKEKNLPYLDGWRGLAIILVLLGHFGPERLAPVGFQGVMLFFVLSGFFMSRLLFIKKVKLSTFFLRRFSRVVPTFWLFVIVMALYASFVQQPHYPVPLDELLATLTFVRTYFPYDVSIWAESWPIGHLWSLNVEEHSYIFLALGTVLVAKSRGAISARAFLIASVLVVIAFRCLYLAGTIKGGASAWQSHSECASLGLVAAAAYCVIRQHGNLVLGGRAMALIGAGFCLAFIVTDRNLLGPLSMFLKPLVLPLFAAFLVNHADEFPDRVKQLLALPILRWFGVCSFSLYLWQQPLYMLVKSGQQSRPLCFALALALGALSYYFFENPLRLYLNQRWSEKARQAALPLAGGAMPTDA